MAILIGVDPHPFSQRQAVLAERYLKLFSPQLRVVHAPTAAVFKRFEVSLGAETIALEFDGADALQPFLSRFLYRLGFELGLMPCAPC